MDREAPNVKELTLWEKAVKLMDISLFVSNIHLSFLYIILYRDLVIKEHEISLPILSFLLTVIYFTVVFSARRVKLDKKIIIYIISLITILMLAGPFIPGDTNGFEDIIVYLALPWMVLAVIGLICDTVEIFWLLIKK